MLMLQTPGGRVAGLRYMGDGSFVVADDPASRVSFSMRDGKPSGFVVTRYGKTLALGARLG